ncbi:hypothetical protein Fmac_029946 [Flemingia macrophylla]|uniref:Bifunctional inhibitor/plant lipid transfer protein/seed storage helical domain-containing protein n=1 Tax=Flemingia macrophylla TaxID=520843 RepID=A0ABD1LBT2_9FABA
MEQLRLASFQTRVMLAALVVASAKLANGQISNSCTTSMMSSFTPCANIITGSTNNNGLVPASTCCDSLRSLMSTNMDCACLMITANAPFLQSPVSQALALTLSQACNINGVTLQCKASGSPLPGPGPAVLGPNGPTLPSIATSPLSPRVSEMVVAQKYELAAASSTFSSPSPVEAEGDTSIPQIRPVLSPRPLPSHSSYVSPSSFEFLIGIIVFAIY